MPEITFLHGNPEGLHVKPIAGEHALGVTHLVLAAGRPRRIWASSMMSS